MSITHNMNMCKGQEVQGKKNYEQNVYALGKPSVKPDQTELNYF